MYEALRAFYLEGRPSAEVARAFGYSEGFFRVLCHHFRKSQGFDFFIQQKPGPRHQPRKNAAKPLIVELRKQNHSIYDISRALKEKGLQLSPAAVREVLKRKVSPRCPAGWAESVPGCSVRTSSRWPMCGNSPWRRGNSPPNAAACSSSFRNWSG